MSALVLSGAIASWSSAVTQGGSAGPAGPQAANQAPPVTFTPKKANLGKVGPGSTTPAKFVLTNVGTQPLTVTQAIPSCKCTAISPIVGQTIQPGGTLEVSASLKAPPTPGERDAKVFVSFEGYKAPVILELVGDVVMEVVCDPPYVDALKNVTAGTIKVRSQDGKPFKILSAGGAAPAYKGFDPAKDQPKAEYEISWSVAGLQTLPIWWVVETDRSNASLLPLRVRNENTGSRWDMARYDRQWNFKDGIVFPGLMKVGAPTEFSMELEYYNPPARPPQPVREKKPNWAALKSVTVSDPSVKAEIVEVKKIADDHIEVKVRFTGSAAKTIYADCIIVTETGSATMPFVAKVAP